MATAPTTTSKNPGTTLTCPECGKSFTRPAALGAHRKITHGVAGSSANATSNRRRATTRKRTASPPRARRAAAAATVSNGGVDRDVLLRSLFPNGIPPRQDVVAAVNEWLNEADRLAKLN
jgi:hypothetical protein